MCITVNHAELSGTKILSIRLENGNHFMSYSNKAKNKSGKPNAMILPIPGETNPSLFHNTEEYKDYMGEIVMKSGLSENYMGILSRGFRFKEMDYLSFDEFQLGMYTVGLAEDFGGVRDFLDSLPEDKRPEISEELKNFFQEKYEGWSFAVCVFDSDKSIDAQPIAFEYKPFGYNLVYFPTMDGHDGKAPRLGSMVKVDHTSNYEHTGNMTREYIQQFVELTQNKVPDFLNKRKYRHIVSSGYGLNGDTFLDMDKLSQQDFEQDAELKRIEPVPYKKEPISE